jgi:hypothetical protein
MFSPTLEEDNNYNYGVYDENRDDMEESKEL